MKRAVLAIALLSGCRTKSEPQQQPVPSPPSIVRDAAPQAMAREVAIAVTGHVIVLKAGAFPEYLDALDTAKRVPGVASAEPFVFTSASISAVGRPNLLEVSMKGVEPTGATRVAMAPYMKAGAFELDDTTIVLGEGLAKALGVTVGGSVEVRIAGTEARTFRVTGIYHVVVEAYDRQLGYLSFGVLQQLVGKGDRADGLELRTGDPETAPGIAIVVEKELGGPPYQAMNFRALNAALYTEE